MSPFISVVRNKRADQVRAGETAQGRDGVWRTVQTVKPKTNPNGSTCIIIGFSNGRTDAFDAYETVKTK